MLMVVVVITFLRWISMHLLKIAHNTPKLNIALDISLEIKISDIRYRFSRKILVLLDISLIFWIKA